MGSPKNKKAWLASDDPENIIDADDFEHLCDSLIEAWKTSRPNGSSFEQIWAEPMPVDIILREISPNEPSFHFQAGHHEIRKKKHYFKSAHFIECKFYRKKLSLDVIAKSLLIAIRYSPASFTIASNTPLEPQAQDYLNYVVDETPQAPEDIIIWFPLWKELKGKNPQLVKYEPSGSFGETYSTDSVHLHIKDHFRNAAVPLGQGGVFRLHDKAQVVFNCRLLPPPSSGKKRNFKQFILTLRGNDNQVLEFPLTTPNIKDAHSNPVALNCMIPAAALKPGQIYTDWTLVLIGTGKYLHRLPLVGLPFLARAVAGPVLPEMRKEETTALYSSWMNSDRPLLLVSGPGGVGKTHLCESVTFQAAFQDFRVAEISLSSEYDPAFIVDFAWCAFGSQLRRLLEGREEVADLFFQTQLTGSEQQLSQSDMAALVKTIVSGNLESAQTETVLGNLARFIVLKNRPMLLYIRDLHKATDTVRNSLRHVIKGFESVGWGQVRMILEQRISGKEEPGNSERLDAKIDLWPWIKHFHRERCYSHENMEPIPIDVISASLQRTFHCDGAEKAARLLAEKSQANLQELSFMLQRLHDDQTLVAEYIYEADQEQLRYSVPSLSQFRRRLADLSTDEDSSTLRRIGEVHESLLKDSKLHGCFWLGLISMLDMEVDSELLASLLHLDEAEEVEPLLDFFVSTGFLTRKGKSISFAHENIGDAAGKWFTGITLHTLWLRENATSKTRPTRFEDGFARGRIWAYLKNSESAFQAFDAALGYASHDFSRQFRCHQEIHRLLAKRGTGDATKRFFTNFSRLLWCAQYVLSAEEQIELLKEALVYLDSIELKRTTDDIDASFRCSLHHTLSCQYLAIMSMTGYFEHARKALLAAESLHDIAKMLNRLLMACTQSGDADIALQAGVTALALANLLPQELDPDLLSVNCGEFSLAVASTNSELALKLAQMACSNPGASKRQQAHDQYILACALIQNGKSKEAREALENSRKTATAQCMNSLLLGVRNVAGVLNALDEQWTQAEVQFNSSLEEAAWLGCRQEALKTKQNYMVSLAMGGQYPEAAVVYAELLRDCSDGKFTRPTDEGTNLLEEMRKKIGVFLSRKQTDGGLDICLEKLESQAKNTIGWPSDKQKTDIGNMLSTIIVNALALHRINPGLFAAPQKFGLAELDIAAAERRLLANALGCTNQNGLNLYFIC